MDEKEEHPLAKVPRRKASVKSGLATLGEAGLKEQEKDAEAQSQLRRNGPSRIHRSGEAPNLKGPMIAELLGAFARGCSSFTTNGAAVTENEIATQVVDAAFKIHTSPGPGLLESVYEAVLAAELSRRGLAVVREQAIPFDYEGVRLEIGYRADLIVEGKVIIEVKSVEALAPVHKKQLLTYLRLADKRLGLLINFDTELIKKRRRKGGESSAGIVAESGHGKKHSLAKPPRRKGISFSDIE